MAPTEWKMMKSEVNGKQFWHARHVKNDDQSIRTAISELRGADIGEIYLNRDGAYFSIISKDSNKQLGGGNEEHGTSATVHIEVFE